MTIINIIKKLLRKSRASRTHIDASYIVPRAEHNVSKTDISSNALKVLNILNHAGFQGYLVGGSVRDLLLRKVPKDFDIATNAKPYQIKKLLRNARIIGRRFKLVHVIFKRDIIEVATFRKGSEYSGNSNQISRPGKLRARLIEISHLTNERGMLVRDNVYGSLEEDAWRRDFTANSLYYNINDSSIVDFTGGVKDIRQRILRIIGDPIKRYQEDPVRMLRAVRFSAKLQFDLAEETAAPILQLSALIKHISGSRLFDEVTKSYQCGHATQVHHLLIQHGLFPHLFAQTNKLLDNKNYPIAALLKVVLENTDSRVCSAKPVTPAFLFAALLWFPVQFQMSTLQKTEKLTTLTALEKAMSQVIAEQNLVVTIPRRFTQVMREVWVLQLLFPKRLGERAFDLLQHPRFRAAYDFLLLRALAGNASMELAKWWTDFQEADIKKRTAMVEELQAQHVQRKVRSKT